MRVGARRSARERGAAAVELALVLPVLLLVVGGIIDFGRAFAAQMMITQAAREGARVVSLGQAPGTRVTQATVGLSIVSGAPATVSAIVNCPNGNNASSVTVSTSFTYLILDGISGLVGGGIPATQTLSATGSMRCNL